MKNKILNGITTVLLTAALFVSNLYTVNYSMNAETTDSEIVVSEENLIKLPEGLIDYTSVNTECKQFIIDGVNGIYFLNNTTLSFLSLDTYESEVVYNFEQVYSSYRQGNKLYILKENEYEIFDLTEYKIIKSVSLTYEEEVSGYKATAIGADELGRVYIAAAGFGYYNLHLYSEEGELLSESRNVDEIYCFQAFDSTNGYFYVEAYDKCFYGYPGEYSRITKFGKVTNDELHYIGDFVDHLIDVEDAYPHQGNIELLGNKYIVINSTYYENLAVYDSKIDLYNRYMKIERCNNEMKRENAEDIDSVGVRTVYNKQRDSIITYTKDKNIVEYNPLTGEELRRFTATHHVFNLFMVEDSVYIIEKDDTGYYLETVDWSDIEEIHILSEKASMQIGENQKLTCETGRKYESGPFVWESSNSHVVSVTEDGTAIAWKEGSAVITCILEECNLKAECTITVENGKVVTGESVSVSTSGIVSKNIHANDYTKFGEIVNSYLIENSDQTLTRVEYLGGTTIIVEDYSTEYELIEKKNIEFELNKFGGFYSGSNYNYFVFGQGNNEEDDACEVMRIVKYSKDWQRLETASVYGADTTIPFHAGSLRITENAGKIYIHTCHQEYTNPNDGLRHQANMTYVLDEETMSISKIESGNVSHSFNQFVKTDENYIYRLDHGDAYPRAVYISRTDIENTAEKEGAAPLRINGDYGNNDTGASIGGFELSKKGCIVVGNSADQSDNLTYDAFGQRNVFVTITNKEMENSKIIWLTDYEDADGITPCTPQLIKLSEDSFLVMWEEQDSNTYEYKMRLVTVDSEGNVTSDVEKCNYTLSDCQPIVADNGMIKWYVTDENQMTIYELNPYDLPEYIDEEVKEDETGKNEEDNSGTGDEEDNEDTDKNEGNNTGTDDEDVDKNEGDNSGTGDDKDSEDDNSQNNGDDGDNNSNIDNNEDNKIKGDLNDDKQINLDDAQIALKAALGIITLEDNSRADMDDNSLVTLNDAQIILKIALGIKI